MKLTMKLQACGAFAVLATALLGWSLPALSQAVEKMQAEGLPAKLAATYEKKFAQ